MAMVRYALTTCYAGALHVISCGLDHLSELRNRTTLSSYMHVTILILLQLSSPEPKEKTERKCERNVELSGKKGRKDNNIQLSDYSTCKAGLGGILASPPLSLAHYLTGIGTNDKQAAMTEGWGKKNQKKNKTDMSTR